MIFPPLPSPPLSIVRVALQVGWLRQSDQTIMSYHRKVVTHNPRVTVTHDESRTWNLHIRHVRESDQGCYMCQINTDKMKKQLGCITVQGLFLIFLEISAGIEMKLF